MPLYKIHLQVYKVERGIKEYKIIATHLSVVHGPGDGSEIAKGDLDRRVPKEQGPVGRGAGALLQQAGADRPGWLGPWQQEQEQEEERDGGQVGGHRGQPMGPQMAGRITLPEKVASLTELHCVQLVQLMLNMKQQQTNRVLDILNVGWPPTM